MKSLLITITIGMTMMLSGCAGVFLVGAGVGAGAFSYIAGNLSRVYEADYQNSVQASLNVVEQLNLKRKEESTEELKTIIEGYIYHDTPVTIQVVYVDAASTQISVRTGYVGVDNLEISEQVHADIAEEFKRLKPTTIRAASKKKKGPLDRPRLKATAKKQYHKPAEDDKAIVSENESAVPPVSEIVSAPMESDRDAPADIKVWQQEQTLPPTELQQDKIADDKAKVSESESAAPPMPEIASAPMESDRDDPEDLQGRQEGQTLSPTLSDNKSFVFYPESALTIHSGSNGALNDVISFLGQNPPARVDIRAYTDSSGNLARNLALSQKRVSEIRNFFILHDVSDEIITAQIIETKDIIENNGAEEQSPLTHRVEITISNEHDVSTPVPETVSVPMENDRGGRQDMKGRREEQTLPPTELQQDKIADDKAKVSESESAAPPMPEIASAPMESGRDDPEHMKGRQEGQTLSPTPRENKSFVFYPKSELTIHSGSNGALGDVISFLDENPPASVDIRAYTVSSDNFARNLALSQKRVSEIRNYLILHDISDEIITAQILDETNFIENNRSEAQSPLTHRVEITIR